MIFVVVIVVFSCPLTISRVVDSHNGYKHGFLSQHIYGHDRQIRTHHIPKNKPNKHYMNNDTRGNVANGIKHNIREGFSLFMEDDTGHLYRHDSPAQTLYYFKPKKNSQSYSMDHTTDVTRKPKDNNNSIKPSLRNNLFIGSNNDWRNFKNKLKSNDETHFENNSSGIFGEENNYEKYFPNNNEGNENSFQGNFEIDGEHNMGGNMEYAHNTEIDTKHPSGDSFESSIEYPDPNFEENTSQENDGHGHKKKKSYGDTHSSQYVHRHVDKEQQVFFHENDHKSSGHENHHKEHKKHYDYHAHPKYKFGYKIEDIHTGDKKSHHEHRDGDVVQGHYEFKEPDGTTRTVDYHADKHTGFHANVKHNKHHVVPRHHHHSEDYHH